MSDSPSITAPLLTETQIAEVKQIVAGTAFICDGFKDTAAMVDAVLQAIDGVRITVPAALSAPKVTASLGEIDQIAKVYASSYASPHHITFTVEGLRNLVAALVGQEPGWKRVPIEPTLKMMQAGREYAECAIEGNAGYCYKAMIAAAPSLGEVSSNGGKHGE